MLLINLLPDHLICLISFYGYFLNFWFLRFDYLQKMELIKINNFFKCPISVLIKHDQQTKYTTNLFLILMRVILKTLKYLDHLHLYLKFSVNDSCEMAIGKTLQVHLQPNSYHNLAIFLSFFIKFQNHKF